MDPLSKIIEYSPLFVIFPTIYYIIKAVLEYNTRKRLIDRDMIDKDIKRLYAVGSNSLIPSSLKWGLVFILVGIAAIIIKAIPDIPDEVAFGVLLVAAGAGLISYYFISVNRLDKMKEDNNRA